MQPSRRPKDGRYGENPNRLQHYYQFQVILKPSPPDILELYLGSLEAIGIDTSLHDIRFVEDDWESPTLGAWGLGWEVWCDGMEVTQFTYFQQVGGIEVEPVAGEITYGLERLAMYLFDKETVYDLPFNSHRLGGAADSTATSSCRTSRSSRPTISSIADADMLFRHFADAEKECGRLIERKLPLPAYEQCIKAVAQLQPARRARRDQRHRAAELHPARARARQGLLRGVARDARSRPEREGGARWPSFFSNSVAKRFPRACRRARRTISSASSATG